MGADAHQDSTGSSLASHSELSVLVATLITVVLATGSAAFVWKAKGLHFLPSGTHSSQSTSSMDHVARRRPGQSSSQQQAKEDTSAKDGKQHRPKERRRRGKDLMKELMKAERKGKAVLPKSGHSHTVDEDKAGSAGLSSMPDATHRSLGSQDQSDEGHSTSSRSVSTASSSRRTPEPHDLPFVQEDPDATPSGHPQSILSRLLPPQNDTQHHSSAGARASDTSQTRSSGESLQYDSFSHASSSSSSSQVTTTTGSESSYSSVTTAETSASVGLHSDPSRYLMPSPHYMPFQEHKNRLSGPRGSHSRTNGSWEWDPNYPSGNDPTTVYRKPPRFRSKSRPTSSTDHALNSNGHPPPPMLPPFSSSGAVTTSPSPLNVSYDATGSVHTPSNADGDVPESSALSNSSGSLAFAALNPSPSPRSEEPTPTASNEVSASTQLASLRGALEAAKTREETIRREAEKYKKELEALRWESSVWRQREAEMHAQLYYLTQQLQSMSLATGYAQQMPMGMMHQPQPSPSEPQPRTHGSSHLQIPKPTPPSQSPSGSSPYRPSPSSSPQPQLSSPHLGHQPAYIPPHMLSPTHGSPTPPYPQTYPQMSALYYPYVTHSHTAASSPAGSTAVPSPLYSMLFPYAQSPGSEISGMANGPHPSSGNSFVDQISPEGVYDLTAGLGSPPPSMRERGRRNAKKRTETSETVTDKDANGGLTSSSGSNGQGWVDSPVTGEHGEDAGFSNQLETDDEEISEALVGAIFKRPESMRLRTKSSRDSARETTSPTTFAGAADNTPSPSSSSGFAHPGYLAGGGYGGGVYGNGEDAVVTFPSISNSMPLYLPSARIQRGSPSPPANQGSFTPPPQPIQESDTEEMEPIHATQGVLEQDQVKQGFAEASGDTSTVQTAQGDSSTSIPHIGPQQGLEQ